MRILNYLTNLFKPARSDQVQQSLQPQIPTLLSGTPFAKLSDEIKLLILSFLEIKDLGLIAKVCKYFQNLSESDELWKRFIQTPDLLEKDRRFKSSYKAILQTERLALSDPIDSDRAVCEPLIHSMIKKYQIKESDESVIREVREIKTLIFYRKSKLINRNRAMNNSEYLNKLKLNRMN